MNILLLTADSLRADRTSLFDYHRETTPFLSEFADRSFEFRRAYTNGRNTAAAFPALHTSMHQRHFGGIGLPENGSPTLAESLQTNGYETSAIHTNELVSRSYNYDRGFDRYRDSLSDPQSQTMNWRALARGIVGDGLLFDIIKRVHFFTTERFGIKIFDTADAVSGFEDEILTWIDDATKNWFVWAHYMNTHHPYEPPEECQTKLGFDPVPKRAATKLSRKMRLHPEDITSSERETLQQLYDASVLSWDQEIRSIISTLEQRGDLANTLVIITADHGELLGEDGFYGHPPVLKQPLLRIPLLFFGPVTSGVSNTPVSLINLAPSILNLTDNPIPESYQGQPLFKTDGTPADFDSRPIIAETGSQDADLICCIQDDRKVVYEVSTDNWVAYSLRSEALEETQVSDRFGDLRNHLREFLNRAEVDRQQGADIDEEQLQEDLAALGYLNE